MWLSAAPYFKAHGVEHVLLSIDDDLGPFATSLAPTYEILNVPLGPGPWGLRGLVRATRSVKPDVIHCHSESKGMAAALVGKLNGIPILRTYHNIWTSTEVKHSIRRTIEAKLTKRIAVGASVQTVEERWGPVDTILNWATATPALSSRSGSAPIKLVTVCNTNPIKRCDLMLDLVSRGADLDLTHIGFDSLGVFGDENLAAAGLGSRVRSLGPQENASAMLCQFDCYVCTSATEGFSIALAEAMLVGLPLAIVDTPGVRDVLEFCPKAFVIDADAEQPFRALSQSIEAQTLFYDSNAECLRERFSPERGASEYSRLYRELCHR
jgi:glycosyltransferase involved in cell wall biosynthesis